MIGYDERTFVAGPTGSGKSTVLNVLFSGLRNQRLLYDTKDEWQVHDVPPVTDVADIDWRAPVIHFRGDGGPDEAQELFAAAWRIPNLTICVHELADLCDHMPNRTPTAVRRWITKGRAHGRGLLGGTQRPVGMPRIARTEAQHIFLVLPRLDPDDEDVMVRMCEAGGSDVRAAIARAEQLAPEHSFVWYAKKTRRLHISPPLPRHMLATSIVTEAPRPGRDIARY